jgi:hypothetical protein
MEQQALNQLMRESADDAVKTSREQFAIELDFSAESISLVDAIILKFLDTFNDQALEDKAVFTICNIYGAYIGEVFRKLAGGQWQYNLQDEEAPAIMLMYQDKTFAFAGICYERLVNDSNVSVQRYFSQALDAVTQ